MRRITRRAAVVALVLGVVLLAAGGPAAAKKPSPPPPDPVDGGIIYFRNVGLSDGLLTMEPDGSDTAEVGIAGVPSVAFHGGKRWFLQVLPVTGTYPNGQTRHEIFAVTASNDSVRLTGDASVEPLVKPDGDPELVAPRWTADGDAADGKVSFVARRWTGDTVGDVGLYVVDVDLDDLANHEPGSPTYVPLSTRVYDDPYGSWGPFVMLEHLAWSSDGADLVYLKDVATGDAGPVWDGLWCADADGSNAHRVSTGKTGVDPDWSPDDTLILCRQGQGGPIVTVALDGTTTEIVEDPRDGKRETVSLKAAFWSPAGTHIVYTVKTVSYDRNYRITGLVNEIYRAEDDGGGATSLGYGTAVAWRAEG
jgi:hypothetical protein